MRINAVSIRNFRCFQNLVSLPFEEITAFIGPNDSGKSSILFLLECFFHNRPLHASNFVDPTEPIVATIELGSLPHETEELRELGFPEGTVMIRKTFLDGQRPETEAHVNTFVDERLETLERLNVQEIQALMNERGITESYPRKELRIQAIRDSIGAEEPRKWSFSTFPPALEKFLPVFTWFKAATELSLDSGPFEVALRALYRSSLAEWDEDINELERKALGAMNERIESLNETIATVLGPNSRLDVSPSLRMENSLVIGEARLTTDNVVEGFAQLGDGTKRRLLLAVHSWANDVFKETQSEDDATMIFAFDEPDTHLHYEAQYELLQILHKLTESRIQVLVCTHSIPIIDRLPTQCVRLMKPDRNNRITRVEYLNRDVDDQSVSDFLATVGSNIGFPNSLLFYERCFLIVEGESESKSLPFLYKKLYGTTMIGDGIRVFSAESGGAAVKLSHLLHHQGKTIVLLLDSDQKSVEDEHTAEPFPVVYVGEKEYEEIFSDSSISNCLNDCFPKQTGEPWKPEQIQALRSSDKFSHALVTETICREQRRRVSKPEFARQLAEHLPVSEVPVEIRELFETVRQLADHIDN